MWKYICYVTGVLVGTSLILAGIYGNILLPKMIEEKVRDQLVIRNGSEAYKKFTDSPVPLQAQIYLFNVTNPDDVVEYSSKPALEQIGPFVLTEKRRKEVVRFSSDNTTLDYKLYRTYYFDAEKSVPLSGLVTIPNVGVFSAIFGAEEKNREDGNQFATNVLTDSLSNETMYITHTAEEILFKGIRLNFLDILEKDIVLENAPPNNTFGVFYGKNATWDKEADGVITISTGVDGNMSNFGKVLAWNGKNKLSTWKGDGNCNNIIGTDGSSFHPGIKKDEKLEVFAPDLCRTLAIEFKQTTSIKSVELYRFGIAPSFYNPIDSSDVTKCYCVKRSQREKRQFCSARGLIDLSTCRRKPIVMSTPHFYNGDENLRNNFDGLNPSQKDHETFIDVEPITGYVLRAKRRLQVNVEMKHNEMFELTKPLEKQKLIHPFLYMEQSGEISDELLSRLEAKLIAKLRFFKILTYSAILTGIIFLSATLLFIVYDIKKSGKSKKKRQNKEKINLGGDQAVGEVLLNNIDKEKMKQAEAGGDSLIRK